MDGGPRCRGYAGAVSYTHLDVYKRQLGILTGTFRLWGASPEGVSYAIILSNLMVPLIERVTLPTAFGKEGQKK